MEPQLQEKVKSDTAMMILLYIKIIPITENIYTYVKIADPSLISDPTSL